MLNANHLKNNRNDNGYSNMGDQSALSAFLPQLLKEYNEKLHPNNSESSRTTRFRRWKRIGHPLILGSSMGTSCAPCNQGSDKINQNHPQTRHQTKAKDLSLVPDNAKIPAEPLRRLSASLKGSYRDDKRDFSGREYDDDDDEDDEEAISMALHVTRQKEMRESVENLYYNGKESTFSSSLQTPNILNKRSTSLNLERSAFEGRKNIGDRLNEHRSYRWSPDGSSLSTMQRLESTRLLGASASIDDLPKVCARRPSL